MTVIMGIIIGSAMICIVADGNKAKENGEHVLSCTFV